MSTSGRNDHAIGVRLPHDLYAAAERIAAAEDRSIASLIRTALRTLVAEHRDAEGIPTR
jgi:metal-responsive CopG/Arc/MetJ family transcriptional regulator